MVGPGNFLITKCSAKNLSIDLLLSKWHGPSIYTFSMFMIKYSNSHKLMDSLNLKSRVRFFSFFSFSSIGYWNTLMRQNLSNNHWLIDWLMVTAKVQDDQLNMAVFLWYLVIRDLSSVQVYTGQVTFSQCTKYKSAMFIWSPCTWKVLMKLRKVTEWVHHRNGRL